MSISLCNAEGSYYRNDVPKWGVIKEEGGSFMDNSEKVFNIAIDGPAGAGKSTIAKKVAAMLGFIYVDTGAMYRAMALYMIRCGFTAKEAKEDLASYQEKAAKECQNAKISIEYINGEQAVILNKENVSGLIRNEEVSAMASITSTIQQVREKLVDLQKELAASANVVMDGRDIGTVVLPGADVKVFLTASVEVRARRRFLENLKKKEAGADVAEADLDLEMIKADIAERDHRDMTRAISPLKQADDAVLVDSSDMTIDEVAETILNLYAKATGRPQVVTARSAGFCFGVQKAVDAVYQEAELGGKIHTYGPIIHNEVVVEDLKNRGVGVINSPEEIDGASDGTIVIRSHGVTKELYDRIASKADKTVDTTCTFVKRIHEIVEEASSNGEQVVIIGNHGHAESEGHLGWAKGPAVIIETEEEAKDFSKNKAIPLCVVAQTTFNGDKFEKLVAILREKGYNVHDMNTICNATRDRQAEAGKIAARADIMIVIGGKGSSNTAKLYDICKGKCERTYFIQTVDDLHLELNGDEKLIGITAGASTPKNIIEEVQKDVRRTNF